MVNIATFFSKSNSVVTQGQLSLQLTDDIKLELGVLGLARTVTVAGDAPQLRPVHAGHEVLADVEAEVAVRGQAEHQRAAVFLHQLKAHGGGGFHLLTDANNGHGLGDLWSSDVIGQVAQQESESWEKKGREVLNWGTQPGI